MLARLRPDAVQPPPFSADAYHDVDVRCESQTNGHSAVAMGRTLYIATARPQQLLGFLRDESMHPDHEKRACVQRLIVAPRAGALQSAQECAVVCREHQAGPDQLLTLEPALQRNAAWMLAQLPQLSLRHTGHVLRRLLETPSCDERLSQLREQRSEVRSTDAKPRIVARVL